MTWLKIKIQLVYSPHKLQKFFFTFKNIYLILIFCCILDVARHQSFISEETEQERLLIHKKCKTFGRCKFMSYWEPSGILASTGTTKSSNWIIQFSTMWLTVTRLKICESLCLKICLLSSFYSASLELL